VGDGTLRRDGGDNPPPPKSSWPPPPPDAAVPAAACEALARSGGLVSGDRDSRSPIARADADVTSPDDVLGRDSVPAPADSRNAPAFASGSLQSSMTESRRD